MQIKAQASCVKDSWRVREGKNWFCTSETQGIHISQDLLLIRDKLASLESRTPPAPDPATNTQIGHKEESQHHLWTSG